ncbi:polysaccharide deacetylase family protein [Dysosmobacter sp.]|uniref:polysaccharide deacetylase family protein n=1 Tax=Dysosmobacter sp. TaxID=2591382 RepID=UPI002A85A908|nr:polysaccharide deacetylase family protein [Dysosmobacter sp.]MDY3282150.1 polysaccharide deacetylase family protein [Dysosmobacter sp.]
MKHLTAALLAVLMLSALPGCGASAPAAGSTSAPAGSSPISSAAVSAPEQQPEPEPEPIPEPEPYDILDPTVLPEGGVRDGVTYAAYDGVVEHLFFHPVVAYPELAFDGDYKSDGIDDWMVTAGEYLKILQSVYDKGYVLVDIADCWSEQTDEAGQVRMVKNTLYLPEGKKPLILSYDDVNYYEYMLSNGFTYKLILGEDGKIWSYGLDPAGNEVVSRDLDAVTILDKFVEEHPDFSPFGAKGCLSLTGYEGILGYRTQTDRENWTPEREENRQREIEAVKPIVAELKRTGWTFGSHTWGHISLNSRTTEVVQADMRKWFDEVGSLVGDTTVLFYPFGGRLDGDDVRQTGPAFTWMQQQGFRIFCSVGIDSWSRCKDDISAVICDRLHPDGTTLRSGKSLERYMKFYDARDIIDLSVRPDRGVTWQPKAG